MKIKIKILCVIDGDLHFEDFNFSLERFIRILETANLDFSIEVTRAHRGPHKADIPNYDFDKCNFGIKKFDILFLFGHLKTGDRDLSSDEIKKIEEFTQAGGGVFGTGDHSTLGGSLCGNIPRLRKMRRWSGKTPTADGINRLTTTRPNLQGFYQTDNEKDNILQTVYPHFFNPDDGPIVCRLIDQPHFLLQHPKLNIINVLPDHAHEGECLVPSEDGYGDFPEREKNGPDVEVIATSMSGGGNYVGHCAVNPRPFKAICAYDGSKAKTPVGRIVSQSTWHHFLDDNIRNLNGNGYDQVSQYYFNLVEWLMPSTLRVEVSRFRFVKALEEYPFVEEHNTEKFADEVNKSVYLGNLLERTLRYSLTNAQALEVVSDISPSNYKADSALKKAITLLEQDYISNNYSRNRAVIRHAVIGRVAQSLMSFSEKNKITSLRIKGLTNEMNYQEVLNADISDTLEKLTEKYFLPLIKNKNIDIKNAL